MTPADRIAGNELLMERINETNRRLAAEFEGRFTFQHVEECSSRCLAPLAGAKVVDFVPLLVERSARQMLTSDPSHKIG